MEQLIKEINAALNIENVLKLNVEIIKQAFKCFPL